MEPPVKKLYLFDFDGVLADNLDEMLRYAGEVCSQLGHPCEPSQADLEALDTMDMVSYGRQLGIPESLLDRFADMLRSMFNSDLQQPRIFPGIRAVLERQPQGNILAIITGNARNIVETFLTQHGLKDTIRLIYSGDMPGTRQHKILRALRDAGVQSQNACLVSDAVSDIREARATGLHCIAITWGYQSHTRLAAFQPDALVDSPQALEAALQAFSAQRSTHL
jgi:phosphoglycolate phosphatase